MKTIKQYIEEIRDSLHENDFVKLNITNKRNKDSDLRRVILKPIVIKAGRRLSFTYRHNTKDITKNYTPKESLPIIQALLEDQFIQSDLYTLKNDFHITVEKEGRIRTNIKPPSEKAAPTLLHDKEKVRKITTDKSYLKPLGVTNNSGVVLKNKKSKYRQINKFIEILSDALKDHPKDKPLKIVDMGSGLGYLSFSLYDYLSNDMQLNTQLRGIELRKDLVNKCNKISEVSGFKNLNFETGSIQESVVKDENLLIALHACDTATDDAIAKGITAKVDMIVCSPCCHKQIRKELNANSDLSALTAHGILKERQAEIITDTIRALILEAHGYKTKVMEFISSEHTSKNLLILAVRKNDLDEIDEKKLAEVKGLKELFGIQEHYLEKVLIK